MLSWTSNHIQKFNFIPQVFCEILWFKESCILRFLDQNSRTGFLQTCYFRKKYKKNIDTSCWNKKRYACKKWTPLLTSFFWDIVKILKTYYFEYFENAWSYPAVMLVSPCRHLWCPKCWNQPVGNFDVHLQAKNGLPS